MAKKIPKDAALIIHQFMIDDMGLSGVALLVYALIYSFSRQRKIYYGTREYLAKRTGASLSAVDRALTKLCSLGFIRKIKDFENVNPHYAPIEKKVYSQAQNEPSGEADTSTYGQRFECDEPSFCVGEVGVLTAKEKDKKKNITTATKATDKGWENSLSPSLFRFFGAEGLVMMTEEQYSSLCSILGDKTAEAYVCRVEAFLLSNPSAYLKNHYKTILDWVKEDTEL